MASVRELHDDAMRITQDAYLARRDGSTETAPLFRDALKLEWHAASMIAVGDGPEPTRSILYRSAAWLALDGGCPVIAEQLARTGLEGTPPAEIKRELYQVLRAARKAQKGATDDGS